MIFFKVPFKSNLPSSLVTSPKRTVKPTYLTRNLFCCAFGGVDYVRDAHLDHYYLNRVLCARVCISHQYKSLPHTLTFVWSRLDLGLHRLLCCSHMCIYLPGSCKDTGINIEVTVSWTLNLFTDSYL